MSGAFAVLLLITAAILAVYADDWDDEVSAADNSLKGSIDKIPPSLRAATVRVFSL